MSTLFPSSRPSFDLLDWVDTNLVGDSTDDIAIVLSHGPKLYNTTGDLTTPSGRMPGFAWQCLVQLTERLRHGEQNEVLQILTLNTKPYTPDSKETDIEFSL